MKWKYGMVKVAEERDPETNDLIEEIFALVELYDLTGEGDFTDGFARASLCSPKELEMAHTDVERDGPNYYFYHNGVFAWDGHEKFWEWKPFQKTVDE